jgi:hypothetical protein
VSINFIPNDPLSQPALAMIQKAPRPDRTASQAGFTFTDPASEGEFALGTAEFLFWQCREAALAAVETWEQLDKPLARWARARPNRRKLKLLQNSRDPRYSGVRRLNAFYDGNSLSFFEYSDGTKTTFSGASTDVVAHETGHGLLDAIRPDLWDRPVTEVGAFHEAFGDCMAILTALADQPTREALLLLSPDLGAPNFVEATAEDLSDGVRRALGPQHPAAEPRHALNTFRWQLPSSLPRTGRPAQLTSEVHSFARVFTGCFYDAVRNLFAAQALQDQATLWLAAETAGRLLIAGARAASDTARFFQAVGRGMALADQQLHGGANAEALRQAFADHSIALGEDTALAPSRTLAGAAPKLAARAKGAILSAETRDDIRRRIDAPAGARLDVSPLNVGGQRVARVVHEREVPLGDVDRRLRGVVARTAEPVLVGAAGSRAAVLGALPEDSTTADEVRTFVETLLAHDRIDFGRTPAGAVAAAAPGDSLPTHTVRTRGKKKVLTRVRFLCHRTP